MKAIIMIRRMGKTLSVFLFLILSLALSAQDYTLVWSDEFDYDGLPDPDYWSYEVGYIRNNESQYYTEARIENTHVGNGYLTIESRKDHWNNHTYTSASLITKGKKEFTYGRFEIRAKIDIQEGSWPAFWSLGVSIGEVGWPECGEVDIMEYYRGKTLMNVFYGNEWNSSTVRVDTAWAKKFHVWRMDWDEHTIKLYQDDVLFTAEDISTNDIFHKPVYLIVNQAIGGTNGGSVENTTFPVKLIVDYVRVYKKISGREEGYQEVDGGLYSKKRFNQR
jgi:beta-glucanase (GH16 family)